MKNKVKIIGNDRNCNSFTSNVKKDEIEIYNILIRLVYEKPNIYKEEGKRKPTVAEPKVRDRSWKTNAALRKAPDKS